MVGVSETKYLLIFFLSKEATNISVCKEESNQLLELSSSWNSEHPTCK